MKAVFFSLFQVAFHCFTVNLRNHLDHKYDQLKAATNQEGETGLAL